MSEESPFHIKRREFCREKTSYESFQSYVTTHLNKMFMDYLPSDDIKAMSPEYMYPLGVLVFISLIGIFLAVFITGFNSSINEEFLSPSDGKTASRNCISIPAINTGTYLATQQGFWQGQDGFEYDEASYQLTVISTAFSSDEYAYLMNSIYDSLQFVKNISINYDLASNLIYWMSAVFIPYAGNTAQRINFMGTPLVVLDRQKTDGSISSVLGDCNATSTANFNSENGLLTVSYNYEEYLNNPVCNDSISPVYLNYVPETDNGHFSIQLDSRSVVTALAVNTGVISIDSLVSIKSLSSLYEYEGVVYNVSVVYDPKYNGMDPINCINFDVPSASAADYSFCIMQLSNGMYALPLFNHFGSSADMPMPCNCSELDPAELQNSYSNCNLFNFLTGVLFFETGSPDTIMDLWLRAGLTVINQVLTSPINNQAFDAQFIGSYYGRSSANRSLFESPTYREQAYAFCALPDRNMSCSLLTFTSFDVTPLSWAVTDYYYQLLYGACRNSFVPDYANWQKLIEQPFAPLNQDYQKCHSEYSTVVINQAGSSVGNLSILAPLCIAAILVAVYVAQLCGAVHIKKTYTNAEKDQALEDLALKLLLTRDRNRDRGDESSVLAKLVHELGRELDPSEPVYRDQEQDSENDQSRQGGLVNWSALQQRVGIKNRLHSTASATAGMPQSDDPTASVASASVCLDPEDGVELGAVGSPIHFLDVASTVLSVQRARGRYTIMNDYEVTPSLLQMCTAASASSDEQTAGSSARLLDTTALFALLDRLIVVFTAALEDPTQSAWAVASQTAILRAVDVTVLPLRSHPALYYKTHSLLALHAAVMLNLPLADIKNSPDQVAYIVGTEVLTLAALRKKL